MKAIIFDLDGTLVDSRDSILASLEYAWGQIGYEGMDFDRQRAVQHDLRTTVTHAAQERGLSLSEDQILNFIRSYRRHHSENPEMKMKVYDGVFDLVSNLRSSFSVAVATTKHSEQAQHVLKSLGLAHLFDHIQGTDPGLRYKPAPDILLATMKALCLEGQPAIYVGDSAHDMTAAKSANMIAVGATYGFGGRDHLELDTPHHYLDDIRDLRRIISEPRL